jgi:hypothetical protein
MSKEKFESGLSERKIMVQDVYLNCAKDTPQKKNKIYIYIYIYIYVFLIR